VRRVHNLRERRDSGMYFIVVCCQRNTRGRTDHIWFAMLLSSILVLSMTPGRYRLRRYDWVKRQSWCDYNVSGAVVEAPTLCPMRSPCELDVVRILCQCGGYMEVRFLKNSPVFGPGRSACAGYSHAAPTFEQREQTGRARLLGMISNKIQAQR
jgi:hypothetical protein